MHNRYADSLQRGIPREDRQKGRKPLGLTKYYRLQIWRLTQSFTYSFDSVGKRPNSPKVWEVKCILF